MTVKCTCRMYCLPVNSVMSNILHKGLIQPGDTNDIQVGWGSYKTFVCKEEKLCPFIKLLYIQWWHICVWL